MCPPLYHVEVVAAPAVRGRGEHAALDGFHPAVAAWFARRFPEGPTEAQARGWSLIAGGQDTLIAAPTGSGKTLAGFLVAIDALYRAYHAGEDITGG
ncbi:MAG: DEAD/DEAH box helicase, partial [Chloroflexi bacterium]|nr:DEAD/DEAH box helicase [Chloroflexota bacterium]